MKKTAVIFSIMIVVLLGTAFFLAPKERSWKKEVREIWEENMCAEAGQFSINTCWSIDGTEQRNGRDDQFYLEDSRLYYEEEIYDTFTDEGEEPEQTIKTSENGQDLLVRRKEDSTVYTIKQDRFWELRDFFETFWEDSFSNEKIVKSEKNGEMIYYIVFSESYCKEKSNALSALASKEITITVTSGGILKKLLYETSGTVAENGQNLPVSQRTEIDFQF